MISTCSPTPTGSCVLPSVAGEPPAADRVQQLLAAAFGESWSPAKAKELLEQAGSKKKNLADWLRDEFFKQHCALFGNRPFVWHIWDGQRDGFSALVNYHRLDRKTLEKLTYTYLGQDWVERQRAEVRDEVAGAEARLAAALGLQRKLEAILEGEAPLDIYVRWKEMHEQPIGWEPDLNDGVRLNIRPFVEAGVLAVAVQHPLAQGPWQEPRRHRTAQRHPPHAGREARSTEEGRPGMSETVLDRVVGCLRAALDAFNPNVRVPPVALLWTDEGAQWAPIVPRIAEHLPVVSLGDVRPRGAARPGVLAAMRRGPDDRCRASRGTGRRVPAGRQPQRAAGCGHLPAGAGADRRAAVPEPVVLAPQQP